MELHWSKRWIEEEMGRGRKREENEMKMEVEGEGSPCSSLCCVRHCTLSLLDQSQYRRLGL
jgi:hypothetical protein